MALRRKNRLAKKDFRKVFKEGDAVRGTFFFIKFRRNNLGFPRFGIVVPIKITKGAVARNRIKRILSEVIRSHTMTSGIGLDVIITVKAKGEEEDLKMDLANLLAKKLSPHD